MKTNANKRLSLLVKVSGEFVCLTVKSLLTGAVQHEVIPITLNEHVQDNKECVVINESEQDSEEEVVNDESDTEGGN